MISFAAVIQKFGKQGEKTGWTYISIPETVAQQLKPGNKKSFRVKGKLDDYAISGMALLPMGGGDFILVLNATTRKGIKKMKGAKVQVQLAVDKNEPRPPAEFLECLEDEPEALAFYKTLPKSHQHYFGTWIKSAKTEVTRTKRIAQAVNALSKHLHYGLMVRSLKAQRADGLEE